MASTDPTLRDDTVAFSVSLFDDADDEMIGQRTEIPFLPYPGLTIIYEGGAWMVERVQVAIAQPGSMAAQFGEPPLVDVMVTRSTGVHHA